MEKLFDAGFMWEAVPKIAQKIPVTLFILLASLLLGLLLALAAAMARLYRVRILQTVAAGYVSFIRGTPFLVQLFLVYYLLPAAVGALGADITGWSKLAFVVLAFTLNTGAYLSETLRAAVMGVGVDQYESAYASGLGEARTLFRVVLPQAMRLAVPNFANTVQAQLKETSLAFHIGIIDVMGQARIIGGYSYRFFEVYAAAALVYWAMSLLLEFGFAWLNRAVNRKGAAQGAAERTV